MALAISSGSPQRCIGMARISFFSRSGLVRAPSVMRVAMKPGATKFTRTPSGAHLSPSARVRPSSPAFDAV